MKAEAAAQSSRSKQRFAQTFFVEIVVTYFSKVGSRRCRYHEDGLTPSFEAVIVSHIKVKSQQTSCNTMPPSWIVAKRNFLLYNSPRSLIVPDDDATYRDYGVSRGPVAN